MKGKIAKKICIIMLVFIIALPSFLSTANNNDVEITDEVNDIEGFVINHQIFLQLFKQMGIIPENQLDFMDIKSADIYELSNEPDFIFTSIKIKDLEYIPIRVFYAICFDYNEYHYAACCHTHSNGDFTWFSAGRSCGLFDKLARNKGLSMDISDCNIDDAKDEIIFKIPKELIGNPKPGDILTYTTARSGLRFIYEPFTYLFGGELAIDKTSFGDNYIIQY